MSAKTRDDPRTVRYAISVPRPVDHVVRVRATYSALPEGPLVLALPVWSPGSYKVRDYSKHVQDLVARDERGRALPIEKVRKNAWRIDRGDARTVTVEHGVYSFELSVRTNHIDDRHAFICGTNTFLYIEGQLDRPALLEVDAPEGWETCCSLDPEPSNGRRRVFSAKDYDELADSPIELGPFERVTFDAAGIPHEVVVSGGGNRATRAWVEDLKKIIAKEVELFAGDLPCPRYSFIVHLFAKGQGGLEHLNSTAIQFPRTKLRKKKDYERFLSLLAHEYFHLWNGKRIRPEPLGPFDYDQEVHTKCLWLVEGVTAYYDELLLPRAGVMTGDRYLELQGEHLRSLLDTPGRKKQSLAEASYDAWIKFYQRDENSQNSSVSYYEKGQLIALLLDLEIRERTGSKKSLDDVMRLLWERYGRAPRGYAEDPRPLFEEATGLDLSSFFAAYVEGTEEPDWARTLSFAGLQLTPPKRKKSEGRHPKLGIVVEKRDGRLEVGTVLDGGPGAAAGLSAKDELVALNGRRLYADTLDDRLQDHQPGDRVKLLLFRDEDQREVEVVLADADENAPRITKQKEASPAQKALFEAWVGRPWDDKDEDE